MLKLSKKLERSKKGLREFSTDGEKRREVTVTPISLQADIDSPVPSICFKAYSFGSDLKRSLPRSEKNLPYK
jgi:hypothetical protein